MASNIIYPKKNIKIVGTNGKSVQIDQDSIESFNKGSYHPEFKPNKTITSHQSISNLTLQQKLEQKQKSRLQKNKQQREKKEELKVQSEALPQLIIKSEDVYIQFLEWAEAVGPLPTASNQSPNIYLDPTDGDDSNTGSSIAEAIATFERAVALANGYDNATINIVGSVSVDLGASPSFKARQCINLVGTTTINLDTTVQTATPQVTYETNTVITVADTLVAAAHVGEILTFTSGAFNGQSFTIITNTTNSITIAGNVAASNGDEFQVTTPNASLVQSSGDVTWTGTWTFTNVLCGTTTEKWIADCDSCLVFTASTIDAVLDSNKRSFVSINACYIIKAVTTEFSDSWWIRNSLISGVTLTLTNTENLIQNVWFENVPFDTIKARLVFENCYFNVTTHLINNSTRCSYENCFWNITDSSAQGVFIRKSSLVQMLSNICIQGNITSNAIAINQIATLELFGGCTLLINKSVGGGVGISCNVGSHLFSSADITFDGDYGSGLNLLNNGVFNGINGSLTFNGGAYTNFITINNDSEFYTENVSISCTTATTATQYISMSNNCTAYLATPQTIDGIATDGILVESSTLVMRLLFTMNTTTPLTGSGIVATRGSRVSLIGVVGSINANINAISVDNADIEINSGASLTLNGNGGGGGDSDFIAQGTSRVQIDAGNPTLGVPEYTIGGNAPVAGQFAAAPSYTNDLGAGTPQGTTLSIRA